MMRNLYAVNMYTLVSNTFLDLCKTNSGYKILQRKVPNERILLLSTTYNFVSDKKCSSLQVYNLFTPV